MKNTLKLSLLLALLITSVNVHATTLETFVATEKSNPTTIADDLVIRKKMKKFLSSF